MTTASFDELFRYDSTWEKRRSIKAFAHRFFALLAATGGFPYNEERRQEKKEGMPDAE